MRLIEINSALVKPYLPTLINIIITLKSIAAQFIIEILVGLSVF